VVSSPTASGTESDTDLAPNPPRRSLRRQTSVQFESEDGHDVSTQGTVVNPVLRRKSRQHNRTQSVRPTESIIEEEEVEQESSVHLPKYIQCRNHQVYRGTLGEHLAVLCASPKSWRPSKRQPRSSNTGLLRLCRHPTTKAAL
jgi:hypothetical protein